MCMKRFLCWRNIKTPCVVIAVIALLTSLVQILIEVGVFTAYVNADVNDPHTVLYNKDNPALTIVAKLFIGLAAADVVMIILSFAMLFGLEYSGQCRFAAVAWLIWTALYICYESAIYIYYFYQENFADADVYIFMKPVGPLIVLLCYWVIKDIVLFIGWLCVVSWLCLWDASQDATDSVGEQTMQLIPGTTVAQRINGAPVYYNGGSTHVQVNGGGYPRSSALGPSHFDVVRPTSACQVYSPNWGRSGGGAYVGRDGGLYGPPRYI